jgi:hypothetical protein
MGGEMMIFNGLRVIVNPLLTETVQYSRSPSRAKRRQRRGFRQHYAERPRREAIQFGDTLMMHPQTWELLRRQIAEQQDRRPINIDGRIRL